MRALESHPVDVTFFYVPQIVQTLRYDALGYVERYIIETGAFSQLFAHQIIWNIKANAYKDEEATKLKLSITLSEVTAVAPVKSPRSKRNHLFGIFCPSKNYRFQAASQKDAEDWIQSIRGETRLDEEEEAFLALSKKKEESHVQSTGERL